jgi:hypothetical protein
MLYWCLLYLKRQQQAIFCTVDNLSKSIQYINSSLEAFGFESSLAFISTDPVEVSKVVNTVYAMLSQRQVSHVI